MIKCAKIIGNENWNVEAQVEAFTGGSINSKMSTSDVPVIERILTELGLRLQLNALRLRK